MPHILHTANTNVRSFIRSHATLSMRYDVNKLSLAHFAL